MGAPHGNKNAAGHHNMGALAAQKKVGKLRMKKAKLHKIKISTIRSRTMKVYNKIRKQGGW